MKKNYYYLSAALLAASFFASCEEGEPSRQISKSALSIVADVETRSSKTDFVSGDELGLFLLDVEGNTYDNSGSCSNNRAVLATTVWGLEHEVLLSDKIGKVYAYYPYSNQVNDLHQVSVTSSSQTDYLYAVPATVDATSPTATLRMKHALSLVKFIIKKDGYTGTGNVTEITLQGIGLSGRMDAATGDITVTSSGNEKYEGNFYLDESTPLAIGIISFPQSVSETVALMKIDGEQYNYKLVPGIWGAGKETTYTLKINTDDKSLVMVGSATIDSWGSGGNYEGNLESGGIDIGTEI